MFVILGYFIWKLVFKFGKSYKDLTPKQKFKQFESNFTTTIVILLYTVHPSIIDYSL